MPKKLNFFKSKQLNYLEDELEADIGYKNALDYAITKSLKPQTSITPGPYIGYVLRSDGANSTSAPAIDTISSALYHGARATADLLGIEPGDDHRSKDNRMRYKIRVPHLDIMFPEPPDMCALPSDDSPAQKYIEMHQTFYAKESVGGLALGQIVRVDFGDYRTREDPFIIEPYYENGQPIFYQGSNTLEGAIATFKKCKNIQLDGAPDGSSLGGGFNSYVDGFKNFFIGEDEKIEQESIQSITPKNTFPRECSTQTLTGLPNTPDNKAEEDNLTYMEEEIIPRLLPALQEVDPRIVVTSVYRSDAVNKAVDGSPTSFHAKGLGVDFGGLSGLSPDDRNEIFFKAVDHLKSNVSKFPFLRTVIVETFRNHIHIDVHPKGTRKPCQWHRWENKNSKMENIA